MAANFALPETKFARFRLGTKSVFDFKIWMTRRFNFVLTKAFFAAVCGQYGEKNNAGQDKIGRLGAKM
jgi:hypothetical protein